MASKRTCCVCNKENISEEMYRINYNHLFKVKKEGISYFDVEKIGCWFCSERCIHKFEKANKGIFEEDIDDLDPKWSEPDNMESKEKAQALETRRKQVAEMKSSLSKLFRCLTKVLLILISPIWPFFWIAALNDVPEKDPLSTGAIVCAIVVFLNTIHSFWGYRSDRTWKEIGILLAERVVLFVLPVFLFKFGLIPTGVNIYALFAVLALDFYLGPRL